MALLPLSVILFRHFCGKNDKKRDAGLTTPEEVERFDNLEYGAGKDCLLDVYRPKGAKLPLPVIVSVHGGAWQYGDKELYQWYCLDLARRGYAVINFTFHNCPESKYPAFFLDTVNAFRFVKENAEKYGFDLDHLYAVGDSAGAHVLSQYCLYGLNPEYRKILGVKETFFIKPRAVGLNCGIYSFENRSLRNFKLVFGKKMEQERCEKISNILPFMTKDFPPAFIITAYGDFLMEQQPLLKKILDDLGVENELQVYGEKERELGHVFHLRIRDEDAKKANEAEIAFFEKHQ